MEDLSGLKSMRANTADTKVTKFSCEVITPLGTPVEPEVYLEDILRICHLKEHENFKAIRT